MKMPAPSLRVLIGGRSVPTWRVLMVSAFAAMLRVPLHVEREREINPHWERKP